MTGLTPTQSFLSRSQRTPVTVPFFFPTKSVEMGVRTAIHGACVCHKRRLPRPSYASGDVSLSRYVAVLATVTAGGVGWVSWEQHVQTEHSVKQTCLTRGHARNAVDSEAVTLVAGGNGAVDARVKLFTSISADANRRIDACG